MQNNEIEVSSSPANSTGIEGTLLRIERNLRED